MRPFGTLDTLGRDLRYATRRLLKRPAFTFIAIFTLALGIGANTAIFSAINAVLLYPLPFKDSNRLVYVWTTTPTVNDEATSYPDLQDWRRSNTVFEDMTAMNLNGYNLTTTGEPEYVEVATAFANVFDVLGVKAEYGRTFLPGEGQYGEHRVAVLSQGLWKRRFSGDSGIIGQKINLDGTPVQVIGVLPAELQESSSAIRGMKADLWIPKAYPPGHFDLVLRGQRNLWRVVARLKPGVSPEQADQEMKGIATQLARDYPDTNRDFGVRVIGLVAQNTQAVRLALVVVMGAVGFVLLIACVNIINLLLAQAATRSKEVALRIALGAGRRRVLGQLLTENGLLALISGTAGILLAKIGVDAIVALGSTTVPRLNQARIDGRSLVFTLILSLLASLVFGLVPAVQTAKPDLQESLKAGGQRTSGWYRSHRLFQVLIVLQVGLAVVLLIGAVLMVKSYWHLQAVDPGYDPNNVLTMQIRLPYAKYEGQQAPFIQRVCEGITTVPGVTAAGAGSLAVQPLIGETNTMHSWVVGRPDPSGGTSFPSVQIRQVTPGYFEALRIRPIIGRFIEIQDTQNSDVAVINEALAHAFFPNENPIGHKIWLDDSSRIPLTVIGVAGDVKYTSMDEPDAPAVYAPLFFTKIGSWSNLRIVVRTEQDPLRLVRAIQTQVYNFDKELPLSHILTMQEVIDESISARRFTMVLLGLLAAVALILAMVGIYGVMSYSISQRTQEFGIRMALGAQAGDVLRLVLAQAIALIVIGVVLGLGGSLILTRVLASLLYGVSSTDPITYVLVTILLVAVALLACYVPARRAVKVDPVQALRYE